MAYDIRSISQVGTSEPFELQVARGQISGHTALFKYGYNQSISNTEETIWDAGGVYTYPTSAVRMTVTSGEGASDEGVQVFVQGLDANYNMLSETVTLNASGTATTDGFFFRVFRSFVSGSQAPDGDITIANTGVTYAQITQGENQTLMAVYTVPAGFSLYVSDGIATHGTDTSGAFMTVRFLSRASDGVFRVDVKVDLVNSELVFPFNQPLRIPEKTDVEVRAVCNKNQLNAVGAIFQGFLIQERGPL
jgi:hypothetical protein